MSLFDLLGDTFVCTWRIVDFIKKIWPTNFAQLLRLYISWGFLVFPLLSPGIVAGNQGLAEILTSMDVNPFKFWLVWRIMDLGLNSLCTHDGNIILEASIEALQNASVCVSSAFALKTPHLQNDILVLLDVRRLAIQAHALYNTKYAKTIQWSSGCYLHLFLCLGISLASKPEKQLSVLGLGMAMSWWGCLGLQGVKT